MVITGGELPHFMNFMNIAADKFPRSLASGLCPRLYGAGWNAAALSSAQRGMGGRGGKGYMNTKEEKWLDQRDVIQCQPL